MVKYLVKAKLYLAVKLQSELIIRAILKIASIQKSINVEIELKFYLCDNCKIESNNLNVLWSSYAYCSSRGLPLEC